MRNTYAEIIGSTGSGKTTHLSALIKDSRFTVRTRHRVRQHKFMIVWSILVWMYLQLRFGLLDTRLELLKCICVYYAALKTLAFNDKVHRHDSKRKKFTLIDEGPFHILLMQRFISLKEKASWEFFSKKQIRNLSKDRDIIIFVLRLDRINQRQRLKARDGMEIESDEFSEDDNKRYQNVGPLGVDFIRSMKYESLGLLKVVLLENNNDYAVEPNVEAIKSTLIAR